MIRSIQSWETCEPFLRRYKAEDPAAAERLLSNMARAVSAEGSLCFAAEEGGETTGLFAFVSDGERYLANRLWLTRSEGAGKEMLAYLAATYPGCGVEFTFRPQDTLLRKLLAEAEAAVFPVQQDMALGEVRLPAETSDVVPLSAAYEATYFALHRAADPNGDSYWTGEMVAADREGFCVLLAVDGGVPVGYLDLGLGEAGNNVADLFVAPDHRRQGLGRKLLAEAVRRTLPQPLTLQVDVDNEAALRLYERMGFRTIPGSERVDAIWRIGG